MIRLRTISDVLRRASGWTRSLLAMAALVGMTSTSHARLLEGAGTSVDLRPELAGTVIDEMSVPFHFNQGFGYDIWGTLESWVVREAVLGTLDFYWQVAVTSGSWTGVDRVFLSDMPASSGDPDTGWMLDSPGRASPWVSYGGDTDVTFDLGFGRGVTPGTESKFFFLRTNAFDYSSNGSALLSHERNVFDPTIPLQSNSGYVQTFAAPVPEPETCALVVIGMVIMASASALRRRQSRRGVPQATGARALLV